MSKLSDIQKNVLQLYARSKQDTDGWATVSEQLWPFIRKNATPEMFELQEKRIRATESGKTIIKYVVGNGRKE